MSTLPSPAPSPSSLPGPQQDDSLTLRWVTRTLFLAASCAWPWSTMPQATAYAMRPDAVWLALGAWLMWALLAVLGCPSARRLSRAQGALLLLGQGLCLGLGMGLGGVMVLANNAGLLLFVLTAAFGALSVLVGIRGGDDPPRLLAMAFLLFGGALVWLAYRWAPMGTMRPSMVCAMVAALCVAAVRLAAARTPRRRRSAATLIEGRRHAEDGQSVRDALALLCGCSLLHAPRTPPVPPVHPVDPAHAKGARYRGLSMYKNHLIACLAFICLCYLAGRLMRAWDAQQSGATKVQTTFDPEAFEKPKAEALKQMLSAQAYSCTQEGGTEAPFANPYWDNHKPGIYVDVVSGEPLFSALDQYDSGTGWPSFTKPLADNVITRPGQKDSAGRIEIRSKHAASHLGHVFDDGPEPLGKRYCVNSAGLRFVPLDHLKAAGLGQYLFNFARSEHWQIATLAGGCFWGMEEILGRMPGVIETQVGYTGGTLDGADYDAVCTGQTGHAETVQILFDPAKLRYDDILYLFFKMHDPTTVNRQGNDVGTQYRSAIFFDSPAQHDDAQRIMRQVARSGAWHKPLTTQLVPLGSFWRAEAHHQKYLEKNPLGYRCHNVRALDFR